MKRDVLVVLLVLLVVATMGAYKTQLPHDQIIVPMYRVSPQVQWEEKGPITAQQAYPAAANRDYEAVAALPDANIIEFDIPNDALGGQLRFQTTADADSTTISILAAASDKKKASVLYDDYMFGGQVALTGGKQVGSHTNVYVDTVVCTHGVLDLTAKDSGNDRVGVVEIGDLRGLKRLRIIATTLHAASSLYVEFRWF